MKNNSCRSNQIVHENFHLACNLGLEMGNFGNRMEGVRLDKWLWAVRIYKTRSLAAEACKKGRILVNGEQAKPSREIKCGDKLLVRKMPIVYALLVKGVLEKRVSAKLAPEYVEDQTSVEELNKLNVKETFYINRERGTGRPTKKERRDIDKLHDGLD